MTTSRPSRVTAAVARIVRPSDVAEGRLTRLLGALWSTGGLWHLVGWGAGLFDDGWSRGILVLGLAAVGLGGVLLGLGARPVPRLAYIGLTLLGAAAISLAVLWGGPTGGATFGVVFVYVSCFSFIALRPYAVWLVAASASLHLAALVLSGHPHVLGVWVVTWGAAIVTGVLADTAVEWLEDANERLRRADDHKTQFIGTVSHELRTPLAAILGFTETLQHRWDDLDDEERQHFVAASPGRPRGSCDSSTTCWPSAQDWPRRRHRCRSGSPSISCSRLSWPRFPCPSRSTWTAA
jgi:signal transduction histidine kinase